MNKTNKPIIGIIGGMGPEATNKLCKDLVDLTPASCDQEHIPFVVYNVPSVPDRTKAILYGGEDPVPYIVEAGLELQKLGVEFILIPCNTSHYFLDKIQEKLSVPVINMIEETASFVKQNYSDVKKIGVLATTGTIATGLFYSHFLRKGIEVIYPEKDIQEKCVMEAIYGQTGIKAKYKRYPSMLLKKAAQTLIDKGAEIIIAGCTEIPLAINQKNVNFVLIDPSKILAMSAIKKAKCMQTSAIENMSEVNEIISIKS